MSRTKSLKLLRELRKNKPPMRRGVYKHPIITWTCSCGNVSKRKTPTRSVNCSKCRKQMKK